MTIGHNCWQVIAFDALRNQKRACISAWIWKGFTGKAKVCQGGNKLVIKIGLQRGLAIGKITLGLEGDAAGEFVFKITIVEIIINSAQCLITAHCHALPFTRSHNAIRVSLE